MRLDLRKQSFLAVKKQLHATYSSIDVVYEVIEKLSEISPTNLPDPLPLQRELSGKTREQRDRAKQDGSAPSLGFIIVKPWTHYSAKQQVLL